MLLYMVALWYHTITSLYGEIQGKIDEDRKIVTEFLESL